MITHQQLQDYQIVHLLRESFAYKHLYHSNLTQLFDLISDQIEFILDTKVLSLYLYSEPFDNGHCVICNQEFTQGFILSTIEFCAEHINVLKDYSHRLYINQTLSSDPGILSDNRYFWTNTDIYDLIRLPHIHNCQLTLRRLSLSNSICLLNNSNQVKGICLECAKLILFRDWLKLKHVVLTILNLDLIYDLKKYILFFIY